MRKPIIAIVGRPNVGKSTLFNRIIKKRKAIVDSTPGLTRDRNYATADWNGISFDVVDTGGYIPSPQNVIEEGVREQVSYAIREADRILFVVDVSTGITDIDYQVGKLLLKSGKMVIPVVNKVDNEKRELDAVEFYKLGFGEPLTISASIGRKINDLLDKIIDGLKNIGGEQPEEERHEIKIAVIGKPNVGKSSLINALLQSSKMVVTDIPGTTRDAVDSLLRYKNTTFRIIDTAGLRKGQTGLEGIEYYSGLRALETIEHSNIVILMVDAGTGLERQDTRIMMHAVERKKGVLLAFNKWDLVADNGEAIRSLEQDTAQKLRMYGFIPRITVSALKGIRIFKALDMVLKLWDERAKRVPTNKLNEVIQSAITAIPPSRFNGRKVEIKYCAQIGEAPPVFAFIVNHPKGITMAYARYLEKAIRSNFGFIGIPLTFKLRKRQRESR